MIDMIFMTDSVQRCDTSVNKRKGGPGAALRPLAKSVYFRGAALAPAPPFVIVTPGWVRGAAAAAAALESAIDRSSRQRDLSAS